MESQDVLSEIRFRLFNCDGTFSLDIVEELLNAVKDELPFSFSIVKHPFSLPQMRDLSTEVSTLDMDFAIFVVHAHESRLSINEENAGIGYAVLYKALLRATDKKVLIVIGGDDNYKNRNEEDTQVLSRWAKHKIMSQFREDFLDGSTSFVLSWEKKHRPIHEEALLHLLLPGNKGKKFQPKPRPTETEVTAPIKQPAHVNVGGENERGDARNEVNGLQTKPEPSLPVREPSVADEAFKQKSELSEHGTKIRNRAEGEGDKLQQEEERNLAKAKGGEGEPLIEVSSTETKNSQKPEGVTQRRKGAETVVTGFDGFQHEERSLITRLRYGEIEGTTPPGFVIPDYIIEGLRNQWKDVGSATVEICKNDKGGYNVDVKPIPWWSRWCVIL